MRKILISPSAFGDCDPRILEMLQKAGLEIIRNPYGRRLASTEITELGKGCVGILAGVETLDEKTLKSLPTLKVISRVGVGTENIDMKAAKDLAITVRNTPDAPTESVAELAIGMTLALLRKVSLADRKIREGKWEKVTGGLLKGKTVGIVGLGRIGKRVAELLRPFDIVILAYDIAPDHRWLKDRGIELVSMDELFKKSDIIMLHLSGNERIIDDTNIRKIKKGAYIVNLSRGNVVDEAVLYQALKDGSIAGAALDVFLKEPYTGQLKELDNVILTPHIGSYAKESRVAMEIEAVQNLLQVLVPGRKNGS